MLPAAIMIVAIIAMILLIPDVDIIYLADAAIIFADDTCHDTYIGYDIIGISPPAFIRHPPCPCSRLPPARRHYGQN